MEKIIAEVETLEGQFNDGNTSLKNFKKTAEERAKKLENAKQVIANKDRRLQELEQGLFEDGFLDNQGQPRSSAGGRFAAIQKEIEKVTSSLDEIRHLFQDNEAKLNDAKHEGRQDFRQMEKVKQDLAKLDDARNIKFEQLKKRDEHTCRALMWIQENRSLFKQHVYDPVALEVNAVNRQAASIVEYSIGKVLNVSRLREQSFRTN